MEPATRATHQDPEVQRYAVIRIDGMTCSNCSNAVTKALESLERVSRCEVDLINEKATVWYCASAEFTAKEICSEVEDIGFGATAISDAPAQSCAVFRIDGMACSNCSNAVTKALESLERVSRCEVDLINEKATVWYCASAEFTAKEICSEVEDIGFGATTISDALAQSEDGGTALLHLLDTETATASAATLRSTTGVADVMVDGSLLKVTYDPAKVGARKLLKSLPAGKNGSGVSLAPPDLVAARSGTERMPAGLVTAVTLTAAIVSVCWVLPCFEHCAALLNFEVVPGLTLMMVLLCALATPVQFYSGWRFHAGAYHALKSGVWDMNVLVSLGSGLTFGYSFLVIVFVVVGSRYYKLHDCKIPPSAFFEAPSVVVTCILVGKTLESGA
jgi:Cu+-exporting ATPase